MPNLQHRSQGSYRSAVLPYEGGIEGGSGPSRPGPQETPSDSLFVRGSVWLDALSLAPLLAVVLVGPLTTARADDPPVTKEAVCRWAKVAPKIDGKLDDPAWETAAVIDRFPAFWKGLDTGKTTRARLLWDRDALYFSATMTDAEVRTFGTKRNDTLWHGDVFELFFKPDEARPAYNEFQVNPKSVLLELPFPKRGDDFGKIAALPPSGFTAVAVVDGTADKSGDVDKGWTVEGRIPWSAFKASGGRPEPGATWRFALCRYDYGPEGTEPVLMSSAPLTKPSFHRYEDYGRLTFEGAAAGR